MTPTPQGDNLIFLVSQPRAGSTLLQRILGGHPEILTGSEPWIMLPPLYAARRPDYRTHDEIGSAWPATLDFIRSLPGGDEDYLEGARRMYGHLYARALAASGKCRFLDKTPRYYLILPDLGRTFPQARFVILQRNPLAVLISILQTWSSENWLSLLNLYRFRRDLLDAPRLLLEGIDCLGERAAVVRYEDLVLDPAREVERLCRRLSVAFVPAMIEYGREAQPAWRLGDLQHVRQHERPVAGYAERWQQALRSPQFWRLARDYAQLLGQHTIEKLGYSFADLQKTLEATRPSPIRLWPTVSLAWLLEKPRDPGRRWERRWNRIRRRLGAGAPSPESA